MLFYKIDLVQFCNKYMVGPSHKKLIPDSQKMKNDFFRSKKMKTSLGNIVCHSKMHPSAPYEIIWINYVMNVGIRLIFGLKAIDLHAW